MEMKYLVLCASHSLASFIALVALHMHSISSSDMIIVSMGSLLLSSVAWLTFLKMTEFNTAAAKKSYISCSIAAIVSLVFAMAINMTLLEDTSSSIRQLVFVYTLFTTFIIYVTVCSLFVILHSIITDNNLSQINKSVSLIKTTVFIAIILSVLASACYLLILLFSSSLVPDLTYESQRLSTGLTIVVTMVRVTSLLLLAAFGIVLINSPITKYVQAFEHSKDVGATDR